MRDVIELPEIVYVSQAGIKAFPDFVEAVGTATIQDDITEQKMRQNKGFEQTFFKSFVHEFCGSPQTTNNRENSRTQFIDVIIPCERVIDDEPQIPNLLGVRDNISVEDDRRKEGSDNSRFRNNDSL